MSLRCVYEIMKAMHDSDEHRNGFMETRKLGHMMYGYIPIS